ncbi:MAG TPA: ABC transporter permease [Terriglobia bacterium]|nr:ABC transporter permease [Terriglobia bacterium]
MFNWLNVKISKIRGSVSRGRVDRDFEQELDAHLDLLTNENIRRGMTPEEARRAARVRLGGATQLRETNRDLHGLPWLEALGQDIRYAVRALRKNTGFAVAAVLVLALGVCASAGIFAFVDAALIKPLPYTNPTRLVEVTESVALFPRANLSYPDYLDWKRLNTVLTSLDVFTGTGYLLRTPAGTQPVHGARVSAGFFHTLGIAPALGRDFYPGEDSPSSPQTVILTYAAWQKWFGGRKNAIGETVSLSGIPHTIVGVLPRDFEFAPMGPAELWTTLRTSDGECARRRSCHDLDGIARLKNGISVRAALADMKSIAKALEKEYPGSNRGQGASVLPLSEVIVGQVTPIILLLFAGAGLLLLIACVNVTSLLLVRSEGRRREIAVRRALGASGSRLVRQFATEGLVLAAFGGSLGLISAGWLMRLLTGLIPVDMIGYVPFLRGLSLNAHVTAFACTASCASAVLFTLTPSLRLSGSRLQEGLTEGGRGSSGILWRRFGSNLVVAELAIAMVLLAGGGLLSRSLYRLLHVGLGFEPDHLATVDVALPQVGYEKDEQKVALGREIVRRVLGLPGVKCAAIAMQLPVSFNGNTDWIRFVGRPYNGEHNEVNERDVSADYFKTLQARLERGRYFTDAEDSSKPKVVIINQALARKYFPGQDPIGQKIGDGALTPTSIKEIVGVVDDVHEAALDSDTWPTEYLPINQSPDSYFSVVARTSQAPDPVLPELDAVIHQADPGLGTLNEASMEQRIHDSSSAYLHRSSAFLVGGFAAVALLLGVIGLYGVIAYSVSQRTREIGVRMALGAERGAVYRLVLGEAVRLAATGIVIGLLCSVGAASLIHNLLFGTAATDPLTLTGVAAILALAALAATYIPARRATKVDPMEALRYE